MNAASRAAALLTFGLLVAFVANATRSSPLPWVLDYSKSGRDNPAVAKSYAISFDELKQNVLNYSAQVIDARSPAAFAEGHLRGAYNLPSTEIEAHMSWVFENVGPSQLVIIYCDGGECESSDQVFDYLKASRFTNLRVYRDGWKVISTSDLPKETGEWASPVPPGGPSADVTAPPAGGGSS